jgi:hypothetical protein
MAQQLHPSPNDLFQFVRSDSMKFLLLMNVGAGRCPCARRAEFDERHA